jgi:hypothetical protein
MSAKSRKENVDHTQITDTSDPESLTIEGNLADSKSVKLASSTREVNTAGDEAQEAAPSVEKKPDKPISPTVGGIAISDLIVTPDVLQGEIIEQVPVLQVRKPKKQNFIRVCPDENFEMSVLIYEDEEGMERTTYLVVPALHEYLDGMARTCLLRLAMSRVGGTAAGALFLWPTPVPEEGVAGYSWHMSGWRAAEMGKESWIRVIADKGTSSYKVAKPLDEKAMPEPRWPDISFSEILNQTFGEARIINDPDHIIIKKLQGRA